MTDMPKRKLKNKFGKCVSPDVMAHTCNHNMLEIEVERLQV